MKKHVNNRTFASSHKYIYRRSPRFRALECRASQTIPYDQGLRGEYVKYKHGPACWVRIPEVPTMFQGGANRCNSSVLRPYSVLTGSFGSGCCGVVGGGEFVKADGGQSK